MVVSLEKEESLLECSVEKFFGFVVFDDCTVGEVVDFCVFDDCVVGEVVDFGVFDDCAVGEVVDVESFAEDISGALKLNVDSIASCGEVSELVIDVLSFESITICVGFFMALAPGARIVTGFRGRC